MDDERRGEEISIPLAEERVVVSKEEVVTGKVRITTHVETRAAEVRELLRREDVVVEHVAIGRQVEVAPVMRYEDGVTIYPIVEEILVIEKRLFLKEELRVSYKVSTETVSESIQLRSVQADVERTPVSTTSNFNPTGK